MHKPSRGTGHIHPIPLGFECPNAGQQISGTLCRSWAWNIWTPLLDGELWRFEKRERRCQSENERTSHLEKTELGRRTVHPHYKTMDLSQIGTTGRRTDVLGIPYATPTLRLPSVGQCHWWQRLTSQMQIYAAILVLPPSWPSASPPFPVGYRADKRASQWA